MKKFFFLAATLSLFAFISCQDNTTPEGGLTGNSYIVGHRSGELTSACLENYGDYLSDNSTCFSLYLLCDGTNSIDEPYKFFCFSIAFPGTDLTELQPGTFELGDADFPYSYYYCSTYNGSWEEWSGTGIEFESASVEISKTGDVYTIIVSGTLEAVGESVSARYTGPITDVVPGYGYLYGDGTYTAGENQGRLSYSQFYAWSQTIDDDGAVTGTYMRLRISCDEVVTVDGESLRPHFLFEFYFPGIIHETPTGTYTLSESGELNRAYYVYYDESGNSNYVYCETVTLAIEGDEDNATVTANGTFRDGGGNMSINFTGSLNLDLM